MSPAIPLFFFLNEECLKEIVVIMKVIFCCRPGHRSEERLRKHCTSFMTTKLRVIKQLTFIYEQTFSRLSSAAIYCTPITKINECRYEIQILRSPPWTRARLPGWDFLQIPVGWCFPPDTHLAILLLSHRWSSILYLGRVSLHPSTSSSPRRTCLRPGLCEGRKGSESEWES